MFLFDPNSIDIYTDGSVYPRNPGPGGLGVLVIFPECFDGEVLEIKKGFNKTTNNRMELRACIEALKLIQREQSRWKNKTSRIRIITDSLYVYNHKETAIYWKKDRWHNKDGKPVLNADLWNEFLVCRSKAPAELHWQKGKTTQFLKDIDRLAKDAVKDPIKHPDVGYIEGNISRAKISKGAPLPYPANNQEEVIRVYAYKRVNKFSNNFIIKFELFDFEENIYTDKYYAYATEEQKIQFISRNQWYKVKFNNNRTYPIFEEIEDWIE